MSAVSKLRRVELAEPTEPPPLTPLRQALATEIQRCRLLSERREALQRAVDASRDSVFDARNSVEQAEAAVEQAKVAAAEHLVAVSLGTAGEAPQTVKQARANLQDCNDELDSRLAAQTALVAQLEEAEQYPGSDERRVREAALAVLRHEAQPVAQELVSEVERLQRDLVKVGSALTWLAGHGLFPYDERPGRGVYLADSRVSAAVGRLQSPPATWNELNRIADFQGHVSWALCVDALMQDAAAELPKA